jgi:hypothetical protein
MNEDGHIKNPFGFPACCEEISLLNIITFRCMEAKGHEGTHMVSIRGDVIRETNLESPLVTVFWNDVPKSQSIVLNDIKEK